MDNSELRDWRWRAASRCWRPDHRPQESARTSGFRCPSRQYKRAAIRKSRHGWIPAVMRHVRKVRPSLTHRIKGDRIIETDVGRAHAIGSPRDKNAPVRKHG